MGHQSPSDDAPPGGGMVLRVPCSAWFRFVAARDPQVRCRFTPIQGMVSRVLAIRLGIDPDNPRTSGRSMDRSRG
jgi:predicted DCC family thiol-disulfide oxidoreductase YuxK